MTTATLWQRLKADLKSRNEFKLTDEQRMDPAVNRLAWIILGIISICALLMWAAETWHQLYP